MLNEACKNHFVLLFVLRNGQVKHSSLKILTSTQMCSTSRAEFLRNFPYCFDWTLTVLIEARIGVYGQFYVCTLRLYQAISWPNFNAQSILILK